MMGKFIIFMVGNIFFNIFYIWKYSLKYMEFGEKLILKILGINEFFADYFLLLSPFIIFLFEFFL